MTEYSYIFEVRNINNPSFVEKFISIENVRKYTGLSYESVVKCFRNHKYIKGWIIERKTVEKNVDDKNEVKTRGVIVFFPDGKTQYFRTQRECAVAMGISESTVFQRIKDGKLDGKGNGYDYPA